MIVVHARCTIHPGHSAGFIEEVRRIIPIVRLEKGCFQYELLSDPDNPATFLFIEAWESQSHLDEHLASPHMREYFAKTASWHAAPAELTLYEVHKFRSATR